MARQGTWHPSIMIRGERIEALLWIIGYLPGKRTKQPARGHGPSTCETTSCGSQSPAQRGPVSRPGALLPLPACCDLKQKRLMDWCSTVLLQLEGRIDTLRFGSAETRSHGPYLPCVPNAASCSTARHTVRHNFSCSPALLCSTRRTASRGRHRLQRAAQPTNQPTQWEQGRTYVG